MVSTLVAVFDMITFASGDASLKRFQILRVLRVLRLAKLLRLLRGMRIFRRFELRYGIDCGADGLESLALALRWLIAPPAAVLLSIPLPMPFDFHALAALAPLLPMPTSYQPGAAQ